METLDTTPQVVTIAGSDSGGGAGIQADLKTFQARNVFGMSIVLALTAQNTLGVQQSLAIEPEFITAQFASLAADFKIRACKTGMLADVLRVETVVENLLKVDFGPLVIDPVMIAKGGHTLLADTAIDCIKEKLVPLANLITPNIPEAEKLTGRSIKTHEQMIDAAKALQQMGALNVLIKGGHRNNVKASDFLLCEGGDYYWYQSPRINTKRTHGTGDTLSSCIVAELAKGATLIDAVYTAKCFIQGAISQAIYVGRGHGPVNHWTELANNVQMTRFYDS